MQPNAERSEPLESQPDATVRMTVQEAASALGVTVEAVRGRMHRGKYGREKTKDGRVFVLLSPDQLANRQERSEHPETPVRDRSDNRSSTEPLHGRERLGERDVLVEQLRDDIAFLRAELEARNHEVRRREEEHREESRRKDHIIAALTERIPELEAAPESPPEPRDSPDTVSENAKPRANTEGAQETPQRRSWLYRFFFGPS